VASNQDDIKITARSERSYFILFFALSCIGLYAFFEALPPSVTQLLNAHTAWTFNLFLNTLGIHSTVVANDVVSEGGLAFRIIPECTPLFTTGIFLCFIVFYPSTVRQKAAGFLAGTTLLYLGNMVRLAITFIVSRYDQRLFEAAHVYLGQVFTIFLVMSVCFVWVKWLDESLKAAAFLLRFALISTVVFFLWMKVHLGYIWFLDRFMVLGFSLFNYRINPFPQPHLYYETFGIVTFTSLVLAVRSVPWSTRIKGLAAGLGLFFLIHLFHRIDNALIVLFNFTSAVTVDLTLVLLGQYLLPVLLLIYLIRKVPTQSVKVSEGVRHKMGYQAAGQRH
jgi:exosortase/archaeosortase family protein